MTRENATLLYSEIKDFRNAAMDKVHLHDYIKLRLKLKTIFDEYMAFKEETSAQTKPVGWKEEDGLGLWKESFNPIMQKYGAEKVQVETNILSFDEVISLIEANNVAGEKMDIVLKQLVIWE